MNAKKIIITAVALAAVVAGVWGYHRYTEYLKDRADAEAEASIKEFFRILGPGDLDPAKRPALVENLAKMEEISTRCRDYMRESMLDRRADGAFLLGDFAKAEEIMCSMPGHTEAWRDGVRAKVRAHAALAKKDLRTAVAEFGRFCDVISADKDFQSELDPQTGMEWPKSAILAFNYRRMSALSAEAGDSDAAAKYREQAVKFAADALAEAEQEDRTKLAEIFSDLVKPEARGEAKK